MTISNPDLRSSSETGANAGERSRKTSLFLFELDVKKPLVASTLQRSEQQRPYNLV
jgi:hypothetical protein